MADSRTGAGDGDCRHSANIKSELVTNMIDAVVLFDGGRFSKQIKRKVQSDPLSRVRDSYWKEECKNQ